MASCNRRRVPMSGPTLPPAPPLAGSLGDDPPRPQRRADHPLVAPLGTLSHPLPARPPSPAPPPMRWSPAPDRPPILSWSRQQVPSLRGTPPVAEASPVTTTRRPTLLPPPPARRSARQQAARQATRRSAHRARPAVTVAVIPVPPTLAARSPTGGAPR